MSRTLVNQCDNAGFTKNRIALVPVRESPVQFRCPTPVEPRRSTMELVLESQSDEHGHAEVIVIEEGTEAAIAVAISDQP